MWTFGAQEEELQRDLAGKGKIKTKKSKVRDAVRIKKVKDIEKEITEMLHPEETREADQEAQKEVTDRVQTDEARPTEDEDTEKGWTQESNTAEAEGRERVQVEGARDAAEATERVLTDESKDAETDGGEDAPDQLQDTARVPAEPKQGDKYVAIFFPLLPKTVYLIAFLTDYLRFTLPDCAVGCIQSYGEQRLKGQSWQTMHQIMRTICWLCHNTLLFTHMVKVANDEVQPSRTLMQGFV